MGACQPWLTGATAPRWLCWHLKSSCPGAVQRSLHEKRGMEKKDVAKHWIIFGEPTESSTLSIHTSFLEAFHIQLWGAANPKTQEKHAALPQSLTRAVLCVILNILSLKTEHQDTFLLPGFWTVEPKQKQYPGRKEQTALVGSLAHGFSVVAT